MEPRTGIDASARLKIAWIDPGDLNGDRSPAALESAVAAVSALCEQSLAAGRFPFVVGGDHSNAIGALIAAGNRRGHEDLTVVHIDAHHDLRRDDGDYNDAPFGRLAHCSALRPAADAGLPIVQVGIRCASREERAFARASARVSVFPWGWQKRFRPPPVTKIVEAVRTDLVYLTIDVDGFDPSVMPATGTPVSGGLGWHYGLDLVQELCERKTLVGADICEVAPVPHDRRTEQNAAQLAYSILCWGLAAKKRR
jgi:agmatinase